MEKPKPSEIRAHAEESFKSGLRCAESVVMAIAKSRGIESDVLPAAATAFCSGMAWTCGPCGALTGAVMGVGLVLGRSKPGDSEKAAYAATQRVVREFEREFGSRDCHTLLDGCNLDTVAGQVMFKARNLGARCVNYTGRAAELAAEAIERGEG